MDKENIRKALDAFEEDKFTDAQELLAQEIRDAVKETVYDKTGLQVAEQDEEEDDDDENGKKKKKKNGEDKDENEDE